MELGLNSRKGVGAAHPYERFGFFKLLNQECPRFTSHISEMLHANVFTDFSGIAKLNSLLDDFTCNFGEHLNESRKGNLEAAIAYYNYATQFKNDIRLLDLNEPAGAVNFLPPSTQFDPPVHFVYCTDTTTNAVAHNCTNDNWLGQHNGVFELQVSDIPAAGAYSFKIPFISLEDEEIVRAGDNLVLPRLPEGMVAELTVEADREIIVSIPDFVSESTIGPDGGLHMMGENTIGDDGDPHMWVWVPARNRISYINMDAVGTICATSRGNRNCLPETFVTVVNPSVSAAVEVEVFFTIRDEVNVDLSVGPIITSHTDGSQVSDRVVTVRGSMPEEGRDATKEVIVTANGIETRTALNLDGSFSADVVIGFGDNSIKAQGFDDQATPVTNETGITIEGVASSSTRPNALIPSRVVFVLRWDTDRTDIDLHSSDGDGGHIYFGRRTVGPGNLDRDDLSGFGPEVISYRETDDNVYVNGTFDVDVVYYSGSRAGYPATNYTLDVILNESGVGDRRLRRLESITPLTRSDRSFNGILGIFCGSERVCGLDHYDNTKLSPTGISTLLQRAASAARSARSADVQHGGPKPFPSAYEQCMSELETGLAKSGSVDWSCNPDGIKQWP